MNWATLLKKIATLMIYLLITINWVHQLIMMPPVILGVLVMLSVNTNLGAIAAYSAQAANTRSTASVMQQLSTGKRINSSVDDVAGLAISTRLMSQIRGLNQAIRNSNDGISLLQTVDGAYEGITNALQRMRELRVQSLSDTNNAKDKSYLELEISSLKNEIQRIVKTIQFNGANILDGSGGTDTGDGYRSYSFGTDPNGASHSIAIPDLRNFTVPISEIPTSSQTISGSPTPPASPFDTYVFESDGDRGFFSSGDAIGGIAAADFDGNGTLDLVATDPVLNTIQIFRGLGNGSFNPGNAYYNTYTTGTKPISVLVGDVNNDGKKDVFTVNVDGQSITTFLGKGDGSFEEAHYYYTMFPSSDAVLTDLNHDGNLDFFYESTGYFSTMSSVIGDGTGNFYDNHFNTNMPTAPNGTDFVVGDINNDNNLDFITFHAKNGGVASNKLVLINNGTGAYFASSSLELDGINMNNAELGDFNNDGNLDLVLVSATANKVSIRLGNGDGSFSNTFSYTKSVQHQNSYNVKISDFNSDGNLDVILTGNFMPVLLGNGDGTFTNTETWSLGTSTTGYENPSVVGDFDNNGTKDIAVARGNEFSIFLNQTPPPPPPPAPPFTLDEIDSFLETIARARANIGASVSRLNFTADNLANQSMSSQQSLSRIQDTDYSTATTEMAKRQIIQQAATAMLAQANQQPQMILSLLKSVTA